MTQASHPDTFPLAEGQPVFTCDGDRLGDVGNIMRSHFEVVESDKDRFWLSKETLAHAATRERVEVLFPKEQLDDYRLAQPVADAASPILEEAQNQFESEADQQAGRQRQMQGYEATQGRPR